MFVVFYTVNLYSCIHMTCSTSNCVYGTLTDPWNICIYRVWKNSVPKFCEVIGWTKTKIYCQATVCRTCILAVPWTMKVSLTKVRNQAKPLQYPGGGECSLLPIENRCPNIQAPTLIHIRRQVQRWRWHSRDWCVRSKMPSWCLMVAAASAILFRINWLCINQVFMNICSKLVWNTTFFRILKWFCLISNLSRIHFDGPWHCKDACWTYSCLTINLCFGPSVSPHELWAWNFSHSMCVGTNLK